MLDLTGAAARLARRLLHRRSPKSAGESGRLIVATGLAAVTAVETAIGDPAPAGGAPDGADGRGRLAGALGLAASGRRASAVLSGAELGLSLDLLADAADRRLPLVVHLVAGGDHAACHAAAASGAVVLFAANVQEAADLTLLARRLAEDALTPVLVAMDGAETAFAAQDLRLPDAAAMERVAGRPDDVVHPPTTSQEMIFGRHRRRAPRWHDPHRPMLYGAMPGAESSSPASAARRVFFDAHVPELLASAAEALEREIGRRLEPLGTAGVDGARWLLVAQGAAVETAEAVAASLRDRKLAVGVVGLRALRPFPAEALAALLRGRRGVLVLERVDAPLLAEPPLLAEIRSLSVEEPPPLTSVRYGLGSGPLRAGDLAAAVRELTRDGADARPAVYLGIDPDAATGAYPKRQALRDALGRAYPAVAGLGIRGDAAVDVLPDDALTVTLHRLGGRDGSGDDGIGHEAAALLHRLLGGHLRSRFAGGRPWGASAVDVVTVATLSLKDPGDDVASDVAVWMAGAGELARVKDGGCVLLADASVPRGLRRAAAERGVKVYATSLKTDEGRLGALVGVLGLEGRDVSLRKLLAARRDMLEGDDVERRLDELQSGFESVRRVEADGLEDAVAADAWADGPPAAVRRLGRSEAPLADLPGFFDRSGVLYRDGETDGLWPEPFLATRTMPPCSSALRDLSPARSVLPAFDPELCTGCGACWTACPDSAVGPATVGPQALLDHAMKRAAAQGHAVDKLRMVAGKLAGRVGKEAAGDWRGGPAGPLFDAALDATLAAMKLPDEREAGVREAYAAVRDVVAELPLARTAPFFDSPGDGGGELLAIALDPGACKGCELCVAECEPGALTAADDDPVRTTAARALWRLCEEFPDPGDATVQRAHRHPDAGALAGAMLGRDARQVMAGGHGAEAGSGAALALRQILGAAAHHLRPAQQALLAEVGELKERLSAAIHGTLADALPDHDLDALALGLDGLTRPEAELTELTERVESAFETERVDVSRTRRLVAAARELADLEWRLTAGESGLGRAPLGLVLDGSALPWAAAFPHHPFRVPVTVAAGEAVAVARGLVAGALRDAEETARILRRARRELDRPARATDATAAPAWDDLSPEERGHCPPLIVATTGAALHRMPPAAFDGLTDAALPLTVVVLEESLEPGAALAALAALTGLSVAESTVAHFDQLERAVAGALDGGSPSLLRVLAPSPARSGVAPKELLAAVRRRVDAGLYPLRLPGEATAVEPAAAPAAGGRPEGNGHGDAAALQTLRQRHATELAALHRDYTSRLATQETGFRVRMARQIRERLMRLVEAGRRSGSID